jgi:precorrin-6B methylase 2
MLAAEYNILRHVEDRHWWHAVLRRQVMSALTCASLPPRAHLLDAGCGTGGASLPGTRLEPGAASLGA